MLDFFQVGAVTSTHGLAGEVKVFPTTDDPMRYKKLRSVLVEKNMKSGQSLANDNLRELEIERVRFFKNLVILKFRGLDRIEDVEGLRGHALYVTRENAVSLEEGEYFIADLIGLTVYADEPVNGVRNDCQTEPNYKTGGNPCPGFLLGELSDVLQTGANDVYEVTLPDGREVLIPAIRQCILSVNPEQGTMLVHLLEGLLE